MQFSSRNFSTFRPVSTRMNNRNVESQEICIQNFVTNMLSWNVLDKIKKDGLSHQFEQIFVQTGDSNDKCSSSLQAECWNEDETHAAQQSPTQF